VTSDILPTLCDLVQKPLPARPLDGISLSMSLSMNWFNCFAVMA